MTEKPTLPATAIRAWKQMVSTGVSTAFLFGFFSLPVVIVVLATVPDALGFLIVALATEVMMISATRVGIGEAQKEKVEGAFEKVEIHQLLIGFLVIGGSAQALILGVPVVTAVYAGPIAGFGAALVFPILDNELGRIYKWLAPSAVIRLAAFKTLKLVSSFRSWNFENVESDLLWSGGKKPH